MYFYYLLVKSRIHYERQPHEIENLQLLNVFGLGAKWMHTRLQELRGKENIKFVQTNQYSLYGIFKYLILLICFLFTLWILGSWSIFLLPLSVLIFYFVEVHFLFLFPLLIDKVKKPIIESIKLTYKVGVFKALWNVMPISFFMIIGLLDFKNPLKNWYLGCLSILFWYEEAIGDRI